MRKKELQLAIALRKSKQEKRAAEFSAAACSFGPQRAAIESLHKRKVKVCGRRSGKTVGDAIELMLGALEEPIVPELYVTLTRGNAKEIIWPELLRLNSEFSLGFKVREGDLEVISPLGVAIQLRGAHTAQEIEKYRGKKFKAVVIDEAGAFPDRVIRPLIQDVIRQTLMDYDGSLTLTGTPPPLRRGLFYECWKGKLAKGREQHHWTVLDNERFPARLAGQSVEQILAGIREEFGWDEDNPTYRREYLALDIEDLASLLYEYSEAKNDFVVLPDGDWTYVLSLDLGHDDNSALAVLGWPRHEQRVYLVDEWRDNKVDVTDCAERVAEFQERYHPRNMVVDQGGLGKMIAEEIRRRHQLPLEPAEKADKPGHIKLFNTAMRKGWFRAKSSSLFVDECRAVRKDMEALRDGKLQELPASKGGYHGNMTDAVLYGWRACHAFLEKPVAEPDPQYKKPTEWQQKVLAAQRRERRRDWEDEYM